MRVTKTVARAAMELSLMSLLPPSREERTMRFTVTPGGVASADMVLPSHAASRRAVPSPPCGARLQLRSRI